MEDELTLAELEIAAQITVRVESQIYKEALDGIVTMTEGLKDHEREARRVQLEVFRLLAQNLQPLTDEEITNSNDIYDKVMDQSYGVQNGTDD